ncbi:AraC family transcriptional regulator [Cohnella candidum]|uniref:AraC family transcriptional regulator n=1 Tax=Cohnella candidum TaxID=2674991 RepID=A0A3G3JTY3_9BACL|nr:AraC family transcriptional regulator [Cohnella candidum]AYQ71688.1 AraC family transcriptional regulator [Cohnella candidum]
MLESEFAFAQRRLNETAATCSDGRLSFRILYWGMVWRHFDNPVHRHSFYEACYVLAGSGEYEDEGETFALRAGSQFLSLPGHWHQIRSREGLRLFFVAYEIAERESDPSSRIRYETALSHSGVPTAEDPENVAALLWRALFRQSENDSDERLCRLAGMLLSSFETVFGPRAKPESGEKAYARSSSQLIELAKRFIRDNLSRPLKLEDAASALHVSDRHLSRMFRKHGNVTFSDCLARERMAEAEKSLKTTVRSIKQIAEETGFQSVHYFTRVFTAWYGEPPAAYRKKHLQSFDNRP